MSEDRKELLPGGFLNNARRLFSESIYKSLAHGARLNPRLNPSRNGVEVLKNVAYTSDPHKMHYLDIYRPKHRTGPLPAVLHIHGGGFRMLSKDTHWLMGMLFAKAGYVVFNISYRLAPHHPFPEGLKDAMVAYEWVVKNAANYGGDIDRLVIAGESAGANFVCATTIATCYERPEPYAKRVFDLGVVPKAAVPFCGFLQVTNTDRLLQKRKHPWWIRRMLKDMPNDYLRGVPENERALADPVVVLEQGQKPDRPLPPFAIAVGTKDPILDDSRRLGKAIEKLRVPVQMNYYPGELHAFHAFIWRPNARQCWRDTFLFLDDALTQKRN